MSGLLMGRAFYAPLPVGEKLTLLAMCDHANDAGENVWPGEARLAKKIGCAERSVQRHLAALRELGYVERVGRRGSYGPVTWRVVVENLPAVGEKVDPPNRPTRQSRPSRPATSRHEKPTTAIKPPSTTTRKQEVTVVGDRPPWAAAAIEEPQADELGGIRPTEMQLYLRGKIAERYPESDGDLTETAVARLNAISTPGVVLEAMQSMDGFPPRRLETISGSLFAICQRRARESAHV